MKRIKIKAPEYGETNTYRIQFSCIVFIGYNAFTFILELKLSLHDRRPVFLNASGKSRLGLQYTISKQSKSIKSNQRLNLYTSGTM